MSPEADEREGQSEPYTFHLRIGREARLSTQPRVAFDGAIAGRFAAWKEQPLSGKGGWCRQ